MNPIEVYVHLLNEGTVVIRPARAVKVRDNVFRLLPTDPSDHVDEEWEFPPGSVVECASEVWSNGEVLVAKRRLQGEDIDE